MTFKSFEGEEKVYKVINIGDATNYSVEFTISLNPPDLPYQSAYSTRGYSVMLVRILKPLNYAKS